MHALDLVAARLDGAVQNVIGVGGNHQPVNGQPHALGHEASKDIAEIPVGTVKEMARSGAPRARPA